MLFGRSTGVGVIDIASFQDDCACVEFYRGIAFYRAMHSYGMWGEESRHCHLLPPTAAHKVAGGEVLRTPGQGSLSFPLRPQRGRTNRCCGIPTGDVQTNAVAPRWGAKISFGVLPGVRRVRLTPGYLVRRRWRQKTAMTGSLFPHPVGMRPLTVGVAFLRNAEDFLWGIVFYREMHS